VTSTDGQSEDLSAGMQARPGGVAPAVIALTAAAAFGAADQYLPVAIPMSSHLGAYLFAVAVSKMSAPWLLVAFLAGAWQSVAVASRRPDLRPAVWLARPPLARPPVPSSCPARRPANPAGARRQVAHCTPRPAQHRLALLPVAPAAQRRRRPVRRTRRRPAAHRCGHQRHRARPGLRESLRPTARSRRGTGHAMPPSHPRRSRPHIGLLRLGNCPAPTKITIEEGRGLARFPQVAAPFPVPARQTVHAVLPHTAYRRSSPGAFSVLLARAGRASAG
jgi:hypothetical protein